jgi:CheY-like chemotaxis protein
VSRDDEIAAALRPTFAREATVIAARIEDASRAGRRDEVRALAHRLVGTAGTVRDDALVAASRELEDLARNEDADDSIVRSRALAVVAAVRAAVVAIDSGPDIGEATEEDREGLPVVVAIEDNPANVTLLRRIFASIKGVALVTTQSGSEGVRLARERSAALVLLDMNLPDVSGDWVLEALRNDQGGLITPVVVISADSSPNHEAHVRGLGAADYVAKPFDIARLRALVREACGYVDS